MIRVDYKDYSGTPLPKKLGIKESSVVAFVGEPRTFRALRFVIRREDRPRT